MRINYDYVFSEDFQSEIAGCGLRRGYVRFLLHLASGYHSFYQDDIKISLSDEEFQLIEEGNARLATKLIDGCEGAMVKVVYDRQGPAAMITLNAGTQTPMTFTEGVYDSAEVSVTPASVTVLNDGIYLFTYSIVPNFVASDYSTLWVYPYINGSPVGYHRGSVTGLGANDMSGAYVASLVSGDAFSIDVQVQLVDTYFWHQHQRLIVTRLS